ncbi:bifunctional acetate--CoA ligase family protein/GNAT family N-acetyltransferase [Thauera sinica]|uniref:GNAT family N-acetyltransferase n=1 Tax=Thauera sinica TaxID=2665146 RepID=A0ABW1AND6_9RHOO|nr:GNAT family N-acetyltransferase [Thauera sp. K11]ATE61590.1 GNAT family N-acetyltransferase [Thauera sp. K11]
MLDAHYLGSLFEPASVAVVGASEEAQSVGRVLFKNLVDAGYRGPVHAVNPKHETVLGRKCYRSVEDIGRRADLAIIATPARTLHAIVEQCGRAGVRNAVIVTALGPGDGALERRMLETARAAGMRLLGPGSLGILRPEAGLNAALTKIAAASGELALVSQSGAMCSVVLDWAATHQIGFSSVISLSSEMDVDFGETLDYLVHDERTRYILLYVDRIRNARRFMSALRSAARIKPIILLKTGRHAPSGTPVGEVSLADAVFDAAMRRAGVVRVQNVGQLFFAARALASGFRPGVEQLAIVTNGAGPGAIAADRAGDLGTPLAELSPQVQAALAKLKPGGGRAGNPLDLGGDAPPERYRDALLAFADDAAIRNVLVILSPHALTDPVEIAQAIADVARSANLSICCCWMGGGQVAQARTLLDRAGIPVFHAPETAVELFHNISKFYRHQALLLQTAGQTAEAGRSGPGGARMLVEALLNQRRNVLSAMESKALLRSFGVPVTQTMVARDVTEALFVAEQVGFPVVMKIDSPDLAHKSEAGGVRLNLTATESVWSAFHDIVGGVRLRHPEARISGVSIEPYLHRPHGRELRLAVFRDPVFGPVINLGAGGAAAGHTGDRAYALPPLNAVLARDLIDAPQVAQLLDRFHALPTVDRGALERVLVAVSDLACELPWVCELVIDPLIADEDGAIVADARIVIDQGVPAGSDRYAHMAIHPYPGHLVRDWKMSDGRIVRARPVRPEDAALVQAFFDRLSPETRYFRFMERIDELPPGMIARFTQIDYDREMALVATTRAGDAETMIGSTRYSLAPDGESVEFALVVADDWQRFGLGRRLMGALIDCARAKGYRNIVGDVLGHNPKMLRLMQGLGFEVQPHPEENTLKRVVKALHG